MFSSVPLFEVLEDEYINLHGRRELESVQVELVDALRTGKRTVQANQNWEFDKTHFKAIGDFARELLRYAEASEEGPDQRTSSQLSASGDTLSAISVSLGLKTDNG